ncbi:MAG: TIGR01212 family radical SAM protein [Mariprofundaceae bacterium]|nr:TIGR01212 family radical SAM protein [Mariprofundaceae bacterium]
MANRDGYGLHSVLINSFGYYLKQRFPQKVHKVTVDAGFTCPNRDGSKGRGGCSYCNNKSFNPNRRREVPAIEQQIEAGKAVVRKRTGATRVLAYFQAYSNTYAPLSELEDRYAQALACPDVVGLSISTRPDCIDAGVVDLLSSYRDQGYEIWLEIGLQSAHDVTLKRIRRGHDFATYAQAVRLIRARGLPVCTHLILGLPGENRDMMMQTLERMMDTGTDGIKFHPLHIVRHTLLAHEWKREPFPLLSQHEYVSLVCDMLEHIPPRYVVHRLTGTASQNMLLAPSWCTKKWAVINAIHAEMQRRGSHQGCAFGGERTLRPWQLLNQGPASCMTGES